MEKCNTKLYVLTGFLGSGKTTLLLRMLKELEGKKIGVIQNEFGKLGIDGDILRNDEIEMVEINRGSIFCSCLKLNFVNALSEMTKKDFEYLLVESSGLGDPSNVEEILNATEQISGKSYDFKGVICLVDAMNFLNQLGDLETVDRQLKHCNLAIITKTDLVAEEDIEKVVKKIREINPVCKIERSSMGEMDYSFLDEDLMIYKWSEGEETTNSAETKPKTLSMEFKGEVEEESFKKFLEEIVPHAYRIKGFFNIKEKGRTQVDVVGKKIDIKESQKGDELSELVFISKIGPQIIKHINDAWKNNVGLEMKLKN